MSENTEAVRRIIAEDFPDLASEMQADLPPCPAEADHLHNLPDLLRRYSPRKLTCYWNRERAVYIIRKGGQPLVFEELWAELEPLVPNAEAAA